MNAKVSGFLARQTRWKRESEQLRALLLEFPFEEELKWGKPCYTKAGQNVVLIQGFKAYCALLFFQGALLADPEGLLTTIGRAQAARQMLFTSVEEIDTTRSTIKSYLKEALRVEASGEKVKLKEHSEYALPDELQRRLNTSSHLKKAFEALTPGRQRGYMLHISAAKQARTREARIEKCIPGILNGRGFNE